MGRLRFFLFFAPRIAVQSGAFSRRVLGRFCASGEFVFSLPVFEPAFICVERFRFDGRRFCLRFGKGDGSAAAP